MRKIFNLLIMVACAHISIAQTAAISGTILHINTQDPLEGVKVVVLDSQQQIVTEVNTNAAGQYTIPDLATGETYTIQPEKDDDYLNGTSTFDMVMGSRHILGIQVLPEPYRFIAMDVNDNKVLTTFDLVTMRRLILNIIQEYPDDVPSWRYYRSDFSFNPSDPFDYMGEVYTRSVLLTEDVSGIDFNGFKMGDLNDSSMP